MKWTLAGLLLASGLAAAAAAQDRVQVVGPPGARLLLDNASVSVIRIRLAPHQKIPLHDVTPRVVIWLTAGALKDTLATGETRVERPRAGDVEWVPAQRHAGENLGDAPLEFIAVVPKPQPAAQR
ncbi:MAG: hypothetical protein KGL11_02040 [Alphaproteobacteria bacterium]|nr:hypothetical protein [Alphaproteobacteria bacterium]